MIDKSFNQFHASNEIVVTGTNPENADYTNPRGEIYGFAAVVYADNNFGDRRVTRVGVFHSARDADAAAEKVAAALTARFEKLGKLPVGFDSWATARPAYGSDAYIAYGADDDLALERREAEEEAWA